MIQNISKILLVGWLLLIPTQLGRHFWIDESVVAGIRIDYLSPTLYLIDLLWVGWFLIEGIRDKDKFLKIKKTWWVIPLALVNILVAQRKIVAGVFWLRVLQLGLTVIWLKGTGWIKMLKKIIPVWVLVEVGLGLAQIGRGGSLGGIWWWLGERRFSNTSINIASWEVLGEKWLRAYGSFSHPNSYGGFMLLVLVIWQRIKQYISNKKRWEKVGWWLIWWMGIVGVVISGSRAVWLVVVLVGILKEVRKRSGGLMVLVAEMLVVGLIMAVIAKGIGGWDSLSIDKRWELNVTAIRMIKENWLWGVGGGNFTAEIRNYNQSSWWQPVHNIVLLIAVELGLVITTGLVWIFFRNRQVINKNWKLVGWLVIGATGMVDHYWISLPQNRWLLVLWWALTFR